MPLFKSSAPYDNVFQRQAEMDVLRRFLQRRDIERRGMMIPAEMKYTETHEWVKEMGNNIVRIGITEHAQSELGDIVYVDLPEIGSELNAGEEALEVESVKAVAHVMSPVAGKVIAVNEALEDDPALLNTDSYGEGWILELEMADKAELDALMTAEKYEEILD